MYTATPPPERRHRWTILVHRCLQERRSDDNFFSYVSALNRKFPIEPVELIEILFAHAITIEAGTDLLLVRYIGKLARKGTIHDFELLEHLLKKLRHSKVIRGERLEDGMGKDTISISGEFVSKILEQVVELYQYPSVHITTASGRKTWEALLNWIEYLCEQSGYTPLQDVTERGDGLQQNTIDIHYRHVISAIIFSFAETRVAMKSLDSGAPKDLKKRLSKAYSLFIQLVAQTSLELADGLDMVQKANKSLQQWDTAETAKQPQSYPSIDQLQLNMTESRIVYTRAHLFIFLDSVLAGCPTVDDAALMGYLQSRYKNDFKNLVLDLITASFDLLAIAEHRGDSIDKSFLYRSFLVNKLPLLLASVVAVSFVQLNFEMLFSQAMSRFDPALFTSFTQGAGLGIQNTSMAEIRERFLFACSFQKLIEEQSIERLSGGIQTSKPINNYRVQKDNLVDSFRKGSMKAERLVADSQQLDGWANARIEALTEILHSSCAAHDTTTLRIVCSLLTLHRHVLDTIVLFVHPSAFLHPIIEMLDSKGDMQGELHTDYAAFGAGLLLVLAFASRYKLSYLDLSGGTENKFVADFINASMLQRTREDLDDGQRKVLAKWLHALFYEKKTSDDILSSCTPLGFYNLVPIIVAQGFQAGKVGVLDVKSLQAGLDTLLQPEFIPALTVAICTSADRLLGAPGDRDLCITILHRLVCPASLPSEVEPVHNEIVSMVAARLERTLQVVKEGDLEERHDTKAIMDKVHTRREYCRADNPTAAELRDWTSEHRGNMLSAMLENLTRLCFWSPPSGIGSLLPAFSFQWLEVTVSLAGAIPTMRGLLDWLKTNTESGMGDVALDLAVALVCTSPKAGRMKGSSEDSQLVELPHSARRSSLREALMCELEDAARKNEGDPLRLEMLLRLSGRVQAQSASRVIEQVENIHLPDMINTLDFVETADLSVGQDDVNMEYAEAGDPLQLEVEQALATQSAQASSLGQPEVTMEEDIFSGLDVDMDFEF